MNDKNKASSWQERIEGEWHGMPSIFDAGANHVGYNKVYRSSVFEGNRVTYFMNTVLDAVGPLRARFDANEFEFGVQDAPAFRHPPRSRLKLTRRLPFVRRRSRGSGCQPESRLCSRHRRSVDCQAESRRPEPDLEPPALGDGRSDQSAPLPMVSRRQDPIDSTGRSAVTENLTKNEVESRCATRDREGCPVNRARTQTR